MMHGPHMLSVVSCCQICGVRKVLSGAAGCLGTGLWWVICGLGSTSSQGDMGWNEPVLSGQYSIRNAAWAESRAPAKVKGHIEASYHLCQACRTLQFTHETLSLFWHQWFLIKCILENVRSTGAKIHCL